MTATTFLKLSTLFTEKTTTEKERYLMRSKNWFLFTQATSSAHRNVIQYETKTNAPSELSIAIQLA